MVCNFLKVCVHVDPFLHVCFVCVCDSLPIAWRVQWCYCLKSSLWRRNIKRTCTWMKPTASEQWAKQGGVWPSCLMWTRLMWTWWWGLLQRASGRLEAISQGKRLLQVYSHLISASQYSCIYVTYKGPSKQSWSSVLLPNAYKLSRTLQTWHFSDLFRGTGQIRLYRQHGSDVVTFISFPGFLKRIRSIIAVFISLHIVSS